MRISFPLVMSAGFLIASAASVCADPPRRIEVRVLNEQGKPVEGATVRARYLKIVRQDGKKHPVPMELAPVQTTNTAGRCQLSLHEVTWTLAGLHAHRAELTTEEAMELCDEAPTDPKQREAFDRELDDRCQRFRSAYQILNPKESTDTPITMTMARATKVNGRVLVNGHPIQKAFVTIASPSTPIDQLFARTAPEPTDQKGNFSCYLSPGSFDQAKIVVERSNRNHVLKLNAIKPKRLDAGVFFEFNTEADSYAVVGKR